MAKSSGSAGRSGRSASGVNGPRTAQEYVDRLHNLLNRSQVSRTLGRVRNLLNRDVKRYGVNPSEASPLPAVAVHSKYIAMGSGAYEVKSISKAGTVILRGVSSGQTVTYKAQEARQVKAVTIPEALANRYAQLNARAQVARDTDTYNRAAGNQRYASYRAKYEKAFK